MLSKETSYASADEELNFKSIADAIQEMIPGITGKIFMYHFLPYLAISITAREQEEAYYKIIEFWDNVRLKVPLFIRVTKYMEHFVYSKQIQQMTEAMDEGTTKKWILRCLSA